MPFPRRIEPRYRETVPCVSLRQLRKAGALTPGATATLRWYEDQEDGLVMVCHLRSGKEPPWADWGDPVHEAVLRPLADMSGVELKIKGGTITLRAMFAYSRAGFGLVRHLQCRSCDRSCDVLCINLLGDRFECPRCGQAPYRSQHRNRFERALIKADRIRQKLGDTWLSETEWPSKPPRMRWATYQRLSAQAWQNEEFYQAGRHRCRAWR